MSVLAQHLGPKRVHGTFSKTGHGRLDGEGIGGKHLKKLKDGVAQYAPYAAQLLATQALPALAEVAKKELSLDPSAPAFIQEVVDAGVKLGQEQAEKVSKGRPKPAGHEVIEKNSQKLLKKLLGQSGSGITNIGNGMNNLGGNGMGGEGIKNIGSGMPTGGSGMKPLGSGIELPMQ